MKQPSIIGGACIIASVCVGAGMLGIPMAGAGAWTLLSIAVLVITMLAMTASGFLLLETYQHYPDPRAAFHTVTRQELGFAINFINNLSVYFVGGILLYAYTTVAGLTLNGLFGLNPKIGSPLFVLVFGAFVWHSTRAVDRISVLLIVFMVLSFVFGVFGLTSQIELKTLFPSDLGLAEFAPYTLFLFPVALTSFGYHHSVSSMRAYYGNEHHAAKALQGGTLIALSLYVLWVVSIFGNLPRTEFAPVIAADDVSALLSALGNVIDSDKVGKAINAFSWAAITSSFIGVGLGVFDYLADTFKLKNDTRGRSTTWLLTFIPPLAFSLIAPFGFVKAIAYAGAVATIWACIIPALLALKVRKTRGEGRFKTPGGTFTIYFVLLFGIATAAFHFLSMFKILPHFTG